jgi:serine/threonine protein kinase
MSKLPFELIRSLGSGTTGKVYLATFKGEHVVVKVMEKKSLKNFRREIEVGRRIRCENSHLLCLLDSFETNDKLYLVYQHLDDTKTLFDEIKGGSQWDEVDYLSVMYDLSSAVADLHDHSIIHFDIKPQNILVRGTFAMVIDYDLCCIVGNDEFSCKIPKPLGTPNYMAPEVWKAPNRPLGFELDVYSLGATFYFMLSKRVPYSSSARNPGEAIREIRGKVTSPDFQPSPISSTYPHLNKFIDTIYRMLDKDPGKRPTLQEVMIALARLRDEASLDAIDKLSIK